MFISIICEEKISSADIEYIKIKTVGAMGFAVISANHIVLSDNFAKRVEESDVISISVKSIRDCFIYETAIAA